MPTQITPPVAASDRSRPHDYSWMIKHGEKPTIKSLALNAS
ncbi:hypothetical protein ACMA1I_00920 [Pontibacter sp. 13R65]